MVASAAEAWAKNWMSSVKRMLKRANAVLFTLSPKIVLLLVRAQVGQPTAMAVWPAGILPKKIGLGVPGVPNS